MRLFIPQLAQAVLFLVTTFIRSLSAGNIIFKKVGETVHNIEYANIRIPMDIEKTIISLTELRSAQEKFKTKIGYHEETEEWQVQKFHLMQTDRLLNRCDHLAKLKTEISPRQRSKRFDPLTIFLISIIVAAVAAASYGIYHQTELSKMGRNVNTLSAAEAQQFRRVQSLGDSQVELARLVKGAVDVTEDYYGDLYTSEWHREAINVATNRIQNFELTLHAALDKRLHPVALADFDMDATATQVRHYAEDRLLQPLAKFFTDWLQHEASFIATDYGFDIYIHVPLMGAGTAMNVYRHISLPLPLHEKYHLNIDSPMQYIAINADGSLYRSMTADSLNECRKIGNFNACDTGNTVRRAPAQHVAHNIYERDPELCLWALFRQKYTIARHACDLIIADVYFRLLLSTYGT